MQRSGFRTWFDEPFYTIENSADTAEFFISLISSGEHWMFISSKGALTAGRGNAERALFPYETVDKIMAGRGNSGTRTLIRVQDREYNPEKNGKNLWEPFADWSAALWRVERSVSKNFTGSTIIFEERNLDLNLSFAWSWSFSHRFGFIRRCLLTNTGDASRSLEISDGLYNLMNGALTRRNQSELSCLSDAYKDNCYDSESGLAAYSLASVITDKAEPREALTATVAWHCGLEGAAVSLCRDSVEAWLSGGKPAGGKPSDGQSSYPSRVTGRKSDFILHHSLTLSAGEVRQWFTVADIALDHHATELLRTALLTDRSAAATRLIQDPLEIGAELVRLIGSADGLTRSQLPMHEWHHAANTLFNIMRGGLPERGMTIRTADALDFIDWRNYRSGKIARALLEKHAPGKTEMRKDEFIALLASGGDPSLNRLAMEYLPLTFSRRHGDPSRPWNEFSIRVRDAEGQPLLDYQGNWRDIFQNWEALGYSYPEYLESFLSVFLNATTLDGYNPYRISRKGIDWEVLEPENPWSNIGYWNDHQIIYLVKLAEALESHHPGRLAALLDARVFSWANVPYRIAAYRDICRDPRATISFDTMLDRRIRELTALMGEDGRLVLDEDNTVLHGSLLEKLVSLFSAKLGNLVPDGGIWMNTQRPEWNDANNALAGYGLSMVSVFYLRRFAAFWSTILSSCAVERVELPEPMARLVLDQLSILRRFQGLTAAPVDSLERKDFMDAMGAALDAYRARAYGRFQAEQRIPFETATVRQWIGEAERFIDASIRASRRSDRFYDSYNLLSFSGDLSRAVVSPLYPMLEGQVAALSSGYVPLEECVSLYERLRNSELYCPERKSYLLYPERTLKNFFEKNICPAGMLRENALVRELLASGHKDLLYTDVRGQLRFGPRLQNEVELARVLDELSAEDRWKELVAAHREGIAAAYEATFQHESFTGRSGAMYAYEGLGSIYWHMVSKLLLALMEIRQQALAEKAPAALLERLDAAYLDVREGIGYRKTAWEWGAFPFDPYSHTPKHAKAQQPGMTGQVKEEVLTRLGEFGLFVSRGRIRILPVPFLSGEFLSDGRSFEYINQALQGDRLALSAGEAACTMCQVPFVRSCSSGEIALTVSYADGSERQFTEELDDATSQAIFTRNGKVRAVRISGGINSNP